MIEIRKIVGNKGYHLVNIPPKYLKAMGLKYGDFVEVYMVDKLTLVIKGHSVKVARGLKTSAGLEPLNV